MKYIFGKKEEMTQIFNEKGEVVPVTLISVMPATVTQIKNKDKDGYYAIQVGFGERKENKVPKPQKSKGNFAYYREIRLKDAKNSEELKVGDKIDLSKVEVGDKVEVTSISKGKGFQGVVKRHGFAGGPRTHGQKHTERAPGSIGIGGVQRVMKGMKMAGRMGGEKTTTKGLYIALVEKDKNTVFVKGAVPGRRGTLVEIKG